MSIIQGMKRVMQGLKSKPPEMGPLGLAIEQLELAVRQSKEMGSFEKSPTLKSMVVVLDHGKAVRKALRIAVELVDCLESVEEWTPDMAKKVSQTIGRFKLAAVEARLHQKFPGGESSGGTA